jgi:hypothetical protein
MPRALKIFVLMLLLALLPLRGLAAATGGLCAFAHQHGSAEHVHDHGAAHVEDIPAGPHADSTCGSCAEHCAGSAFAPASAPAPALLAASTERCTSPPQWHFGLHPERLDRPPLPL